MTILRRFTVLAVLLLWMPGTFAHENKDEWYGCKTGDQCVLVKGKCGVEWAANKKFVELTRKNPPRPNEKCKKPLEEHPADTSVLCVNSQCVLIPPGKFAGGKSISDENCVQSECWGHLGCNYLTCTRKDGSTYSAYAQ